MKPSRSTASELWYLCGPVAITSALAAAGSSVLLWLFLRIPRLRVEPASLQLGLDVAVVLIGFGIIDRRVKCLTFSNDHLERLFRMVGLVTVLLPTILAGTFVLKGEPHPVWAIAAVVIFSALWFTIIRLVSVDRRRLKTALGAGPKWMLARMFLIPSRRAYGVQLLIDVNLALFTAMVLSGVDARRAEVADLLTWGALSGPALHGAGLSRLVSSQFVHTGARHLMTNLYGLVVVAIFLSRVLTNARLIAAYLACGVAGGITSALVHPNVVSSGASGAILGLCGVLLTVTGLGDKRVLPMRKAILINIGLMTGLTIVQGLTVPGIDNAGHLGGLLGGIVLGFWCRQQTVPTSSVLPGGAAPRTNR